VSPCLGGDIHRYDDLPIHTVPVVTILAGTPSRYAPQGVLDKPQRHDRAAPDTLPDKAVLLSFDDGYESMYTRVFPLLKLYHFPAVLALVSSWMETAPGKNLGYDDTQFTRDNLLSWKQVREMEASGLGGDPDFLRRAVAVDDHLAAVIKLDFEHAARLGLKVDVQAARVDGLLDSLQHGIGQGFEFGVRHKLRQCVITFSF